MLIAHITQVKLFFLEFRAITGQIYLQIDVLRYVPCVFYFLIENTYFDVFYFSVRVCSTVNTTTDRQTDQAVFVGSVVCVLL